MIKNTKKLLLLVGFILIFAFQLNNTFASEVTGSLCTGLNCPVEGTVVAAPTASPVAGTYTSNQSVTLSASGATSIRYTDDGTSPTCASTAYSSAMSVTSSKTIKALACYPNSVTSTIASFAYVLQCATPTVTNGSVSAYPTCAITCNSGYTLSGSSCVASGGGGGGGGGGGYFGNTPTPANVPETSTSTTYSTTSQTTITATSALQSQLLLLIAQLKIALAEMQAQGQTIPEAAKPFIQQGGYVFTRNLASGSTGEDVRELQKYLNTHGFSIALSGPGSPGNETLRFGAATRTALARFQAANGISPALGFFGTLTRDYINGH